MKWSESKVTYSEEFAYFIGITGVSVADYWTLTPAATFALIEGAHTRNDIRSNDFRQLFALEYNIWSKQPKSAKRLWPLAIDTWNPNELTTDEHYERNKKIIGNALIAAGFSLPDGTPDWQRYERDGRIC